MAAALPGACLYLIEPYSLYYLAGVSSSLGCSTRHAAQHSSTEAGIVSVPTAVVGPPSTITPNESACDNKALSLQWGSLAEGLKTPPVLGPDTNFTSVKWTNSSVAHSGVMAIWQGRGALA